MRLQGRLLALLALFAVASATTPAVGEAQTVDRRAVLDEIERLEIDLLRADDELRAAAVQVRELEGRVDALERELATSESRLAERRERMAMRLRAMYRFRHRGFLPLLFSSRSPHDLLRSARYLWWIVRSDQDAIDAWTATLDRQDALRAELDAERAALHQWAGEAALKRAETLALRDERQAVVGRVRDTVDRRRMKTLLVERRAESIDVEIDLRPEATPELVVEEVVPESVFARSRGHLPLPVVGTVTRAPRGVDIDATNGTPIRAVHGGTVSKVLHISGYGLVCILDHGGGWKTVYAHASGFEVRAGEAIAGGDVIGTVGETGSLDGPKLHFEVRRDQEALDAFEWLAIPPGVRVLGR